MSAVLIYVFPAAMDMVLAGVFFMTTVWAAQAGASASGVSNLITAWAAVYMVSALVAGRVVTARNAAGLLVASCLAAAGLSAAFAMASSLRAMYVLVALEGVAMAFFFTPFQAFMKLVGQRKRRSLPWSVGLYTFSWSSGYAVGPFAAGVLWGPLGWRGCHGAYGLAALGVALGTYLVHRRIQAAPVPAAESPGAAPEVPVNPYAARPDLAWMAWVFGGVGCMIVAMIRGLFPSSGTACGIPRFEQGLILATLSAVQALVGLSLARGRWWMYRPRPILLFGVCGAGALVLFGSSRTTAGFLLAAACLGVHCGSFFFYFVFHSLVHPEHGTRYVSINEAVVGLTGIAGPVLAGLAADGLTLAAPYWIAAAVLSAAIAAQVSIHARLARKAGGVAVAAAAAPAGPRA